MVAGTTAQYVELRTLKPRAGQQFLADGDWRRGASEVVIGAKIRDEIFGAETALGQLIRTATGASGSSASWRRPDKDWHEHRRVLSSILVSLAQASSTAHSAL